MARLILLLLAGCAVQSSDELYEIARACGTKAECPKEWERAQRREMIETRPKEEPKCPNGLVKWKTWSGSRCVTRAEVERALRDFY